MAKPQTQPQSQSSAEKPAIPNKPKWECSILTAPKDPNGFTVGEVFEIQCQGESLALKEPLQTKFPDNQKHALDLLQPVEITPNKIVYKATAYRPGQLKFEYVDFEDAQGHGFISGPMQLTVASTVALQDPPPEQPFGSIAPMSMAWPFWIFFSAAVALLVLFGWALIFFRRRIQRKNIEKNIRKFESPMGSYHQYSKDVRLLKRSVVFSTHREWSEAQVGSYLEKLDEYYRMFILREYVVPADIWPTKNIVKEIKRKDRNGYKVYGPAVKKAFHELERAKGHVSKIKSMDCEQLTNICSQAVDAMWKYKRRAVKS